RVSSAGKLTLTGCPLGKDNAFGPIKSIFDMKVRRLRSRSVKAKYGVKAASEATKRTWPVKV
ncbi:MAG: hypothetical protein M3120_08745, partial [Pseudomonadota bacterium]|nr:hypothetical protein [Pseudomonadota bacterium]